MTYFTTELNSIFIFAIASLVLSLILFFAVYLISFTSKVEFEKSSAYECGFAPFSETNYPFEVQFALIAIMFLLFDIEVLYLYPLVTSITYLSFSDFLCFSIFFVILVTGIVYEISRNTMTMRSAITPLTNIAGDVITPSTNITGDVITPSTNITGDATSLNKSIAINPMAIIVGVNTPELDQMYLLCIVCIISYYLLLYYIISRRSMLYISPMICPFIVEKETEESIALVDRATSFICVLVNKGVPEHLIIEMGRVKDQWILTSQDIAIVIFNMKKYEIYNPVKDLSFLRKMKHTLVELGSKLPELATPEVPCASVVKDIAKVPNPRNLPEVVISDSSSTLSDSSSTLSDVVGVAHWFQDTWWFPIAVTVSITVVLLGLAEVRNRYYPERIPQESLETSNPTDSQVYYSILEQSQVKYILLQCLVSTIFLGLIVYFILRLILYRYVTKSKKPRILIAPMISPFVVGTSPTPSQIETLHEATEFVAILLNKKVPFEIIVELARFKQGWDISFDQIKSVIETMENGNFYKPVEDVVFLARVKKTLLRLGSNLSDLVDPPTLVAPPVIEVDVDGRAPSGSDSVFDKVFDMVFDKVFDMVFDKVFDMASDIASDMASDIASDIAPQVVYWFPIVVITTVTIVFVGLAELRNRSVSHEQSSSMIEESELVESELVESELVESELVESELLESELPESYFVYCSILDPTFPSPIVYVLSIVLAYCMWRYRDRATCKKPRIVYPSQKAERRLLCNVFGNIH